eukprot:gene16006-20276_t
MVTSRLSIIAAVCALAGLGSTVMAKDYAVKVPGTAMPWIIKKTNPDLPFGKGDGTPPAVISDLVLTP